nr:hypothetical protein [Tanacetum cinerariifolium]
MFLVIIVSITLTSIGGGVFVAEARKLFNVLMLLKPEVPKFYEIMKPELLQIPKTYVPMTPKPEILVVPKLKFLVIPKPEIPMLPKPTILEVPKPEQALKNKGIVDSGCSRHMTGNKAYLADYQEINDGGFVAFGSSRGKTTSKGKIRTEKLDFDENVIPSGDLTCLFAKASIDESNLWHRRLGHVNFETMNKLVKGNLVRGFPSKIFKNDHTCVACQKEKQHKATYHKKYCLVVTDDFSRFSLVFFLATKDDTTITMLGDSLLPITFWAEAVNTACYVLNRALVTKSHNKTPYELLNGRTPRLDFMRPFGCPVTILNTLDPLGKFKGKADEEFLVGYSVTRNQTNKNAGPQDTNGNAGTQDNVDARKEVSDQHYIVFSLWSSISFTFKSSDDKAADDKPKDDNGLKTIKEPINNEDQAYRDELNRLMSQEKKVSDVANALRKEFEQGCMDQRRATKVGSTNRFNTVSNPVNAASTSETFSAGGPSSPHLDAFIPANTLLPVNQNDSPILNLEDIAELRSTSIFNSAYDDNLDIFTSPIQSMGVAADFNNTESSTVVSPIPTHRMHIDHPKDQILRDLNQQYKQGGLQRRVLEHMLLNKKDKRGTLVRNKARLVAQGHIQGEGIDYDEVSAHVARIEAIRIFLAFASFIGFIVCQMDVKTSTPIETQKPLAKDEEAAYVDLYLYRSMIRSLMDLTASRPDIMFAVCAYSRDSPFDLEAYSDSDYAGANLDRKSTTRGDSLVRAATTASLDAQHDISNITKTQSKATLNEPTPWGKGSGSGLGSQETMGGATAQIRSEGALMQSINPPLLTGYTVGSGEDMMEHDIELTYLIKKIPYDSPLLGGHTPGSDKGSMTLKELIDLCTTLLQKVLDLENVKTSQAKEIDADTEMIVEDTGNGEKGGSTAETVSTARPDISTARPEVNTAEPKTPPTTSTLFDDEDTKKRDQDQIERDAEVSLKIQAAQIDVDHELDVRLTHKEQEKYTVEERSKLLEEFFERRKKQLAKERAEALSSKPPIKTQLRNLMMTYLKHTCRFTYAQLISRSFKEIQKLYIKEQKLVDAFVSIGSEDDEKRIRSRKKRAAGLSSKHKSPKKQKVNDQESKDSDKEHRKCLKVVPDDDKAIDYETLDVKILIVNCESQVLGTNKAGDVHVYKLTRLDGSYRHFSTFSRMLEVLDRQDVLDLYKIIMERFPANDPEGYDLILWKDLKILVESSEDDEI